MVFMAIWTGLPYIIPIDKYLHTMLILAWAACLGSFVLYMRRQNRLLRAGNRPADAP
jgi:hypothetical protein